MFSHLRRRRRVKTSHMAKLGIVIRLLTPVTAVRVSLRLIWEGRDFTFGTMWPGKFWYTRLVWRCRTTRSRVMVQWCLPSVEVGVVHVSRQGDLSYWSLCVPFLLVGINHVCLSYPWNSFHNTTGHEINKKISCCGGSVQLQITDDVKMW